ncbi:uncharacterized protein LOC119870482 [Canis lupus familiaris]|uniref:uncharacterized protein LOC118353763 n=1 Tax=Canis lupus dingo TaxID=286419 RepID=UPI0015F1A3E6|nr:uncharacterized protein LOC118353763 [Canis lupus dingo]XP_038320180.1 uncharacterized protein LOC119870482 [Canis lupus familiaris]XP_038444158.1 uncharacterized protein LOC119878081 [Canis lupus familiaris]
MQNRIAIPENLAHTLVTEIHQSLHISPKALFQFLQPLFYHPSLSKVIETVHRACTVCSAVSAQGGIRRPGPNHQLRGHQPGEDWQLDFTTMPRHKNLGYLLTLVDTFTGWIEAYPTAARRRTSWLQSLLNTSFPVSDCPEPSSQTMDLPLYPALPSKWLKVSISPGDCTSLTILSPQVLLSGKDTSTLPYCTPSGIFLSCPKGIYCCLTASDSLDCTLILLSPTTSIYSSEQLISQLSPTSWKGCLPPLNRGRTNYRCGNWGGRAGNLR